VSPLVVAVQVNALPLVAVPQLTVLTNGLPAPTLKVELAEGLLTLLESLATTLIEKVPFVEQVSEIVLVVDVPVQDAGIVQV